MVRVDDRDDVLVGGVDVQELLVAEVLDDVGPGAERAAVGAALADVEVLRSEARDELLAGDVAGDVAEPRRHRDRPVAGADERRRAALIVDRDVDEVHRRAADEARDEPVERGVVEGLRGPDLHQKAFAHDGDPRAHRHGLDLVVGHVDDGRLQALVEPGDLGTRLDAQLGVEVGERFVHEEDRRLAHDGAPEGDALALATRELLRLAVEELLELDGLSRLVDPALDLGLGDLAQLQAEREVLADRHVRVERVALEDHRDVAVLGRDVVDDAVADPQRAVADLLEARDHPQAGGLPAARWSDEDHELAVTDLEVEVLHGVEIAVDLVDVFERHGRHEPASILGRHREPMHPGRRGGCPVETGRGRAPYVTARDARIVRVALPARNRRIRTRVRGTNRVSPVRWLAASPRRPRRGRHH